MTYPPQQPGPYGQDPYGQQPGQLGQQPGQFGPPTGAYGQQPPGFDGGGYGGYPGGPTEPPKKSSAGVITAVVVGAVLVLGGAGTGVYFLTKGDDKPNNSAGSTSETSGAKPKPSAPQSGGGLPTKGSDKSGTVGRTPKTSTGGGGGGGGGNDAEIVQVAEKYAKAVTDKDETAAKSLTCDHDGGLLFTSGGKVEVTGKPEKYGEDTASINVKVTIGSADPIEDFPLFMDHKSSGWCVS